MPLLTLLDLFFGLFVISLVVNLTSSRLPIHYVPSVMRWGWFGSAIYVTIRIMALDTIQQWVRGTFRVSVLSFFIAAVIGGLVGVLYWAIISKIDSASGQSPAGSSVTSSVPQVSSSPPTPLPEITKTKQTPTTSTNLEPQPLKSPVEQRSATPSLTPGQVIDRRSRQLSPEQKKRLIAALKQVKGPPGVRFRYKNTDMEASHFAVELRDAFNEAGWTRVFMDYRSADTDTRLGLFVETMWNHIPPPGALELANALKEAGFTVTLKTSRSVQREEEIVFTIGGIEN
jgi:hypothetical protein